MKESQKEENPRLKSGLESNYLLDHKSRDLQAVGLFYAPTGGSVHKVAKRLKQRLGEHEVKVDMWYIGDITPDKLSDYHNLIFVSSTLGRDTWENDENDEWAAFMPELEKVDFAGRQVALVGLGNHVAYPNNFVDGMAALAGLVEKNGGNLIGKTEPDYYTFTMSRAVQDGVFVGLPLDEDNEPEKTDGRIQRWLSFVLPDLEE